jgi:hypothetical protein
MLIEILIRMEVQCEAMKDSGFYKFLNEKEIDLTQTIDLQIKMVQVIQEVCILI